jgi:hypothetical protein
MFQVCQQIFYTVLDFGSLLFGLLPSGRAVMAVIFVCVERQKGGNQHCKNYYDRGPNESYK